MVAYSFLLAATACLGLLDTVSSSDIFRDHMDLVKRGSGQLEFAALCWDTETWSNQNNRTTRSDILALANEIEQQTECNAKKTSKDKWKVYTELAKSDSAKIRLLWTGDTISENVLVERYKCGPLAQRIRTIANSCASLLGSEYIMFWSVLGVCDGDVIEQVPGTTLPQSGLSGIALDVGSAKVGMIPDLGKDRKGKHFAVLNITVEEWIAPMPGERYEAYPNLPSVEQSCNVWNPRRRFQDGK